LGLPGEPGAKRAIAALGGPDEIRHFHQGLFFLGNIQIMTVGATLLPRRSIYPAPRQTRKQRAPTRTIGDLLAVKRVAANYPAVRSSAPHRPVAGQSAQGRIVREERGIMCPKLKMQIF